MTTKIKLSKPMADTIKVLDMTPTWTEAAALLALVITDGTPEGRENAAAEVRRMGQIIDQLRAERGDVA